MKDTTRRRFLATRDALDALASMGTPSRLAVTLGFLVVSACGAGEQATAPHAPTTSRAKPAARLPSLVVATRDAVLRAPRRSDVRIAWPRPGLPLTVHDAREDGREVRVGITGGIEINGVLSRDAIGVVVCQAGPVGERVYAGNRSILSLRSDVTDGSVRVGAEIIVRVRDHDRDAPFDKQFVRLAYEDTISTSRLCTTPPPNRHAGTSEDPTIVHVVGEIDDEDFPRGTPIVDVRPKTAERKEQSSILGGLGLRSDVFGEGPAVLQTTKLAKLPLHPLPAGTELGIDGVVHARLTKDGLARVKSTRDRAAYVVAAVDHDVVVEGWIDEARLGARVERK